MGAQIRFLSDTAKKDNFPLTTDLAFNTYAQLMAHLSNPRRYPGEMVSCLERPNCIYILNSSKNAWIEINDVSDGSTIELDLVSNTPAAPAAGKVKFYFKSDKKFYRQTSDGIETEAVDDGSAITKEFTGFADNGLITVTYNATTRTVTLTGTINGYFRGEKVSVLVNGWVSTAHGTTNQGYWLYYDGTSFVWSTTEPDYSNLLIAFVFYGASQQYCIKQTYGFMPYVVQEILHRIIGTYRQSGGDLSGYTLASTTAAKRRIAVAATYLMNEDCKVTLPAKTAASFVQFRLTGTGQSLLTTGAADIVALNGNVPYYNSYVSSAWGQTAFTSNAYGALFLVAVPVASDAGSQAYRYIWIQPQTISTTLTTIDALTPQNVNLGDLKDITGGEECFIAKVVIRYASSNWTIISVTQLTGNRFVQIGSPDGFYISAVEHDTTLVGEGNIDSPLTVAPPTVKNITAAYTALITDDIIFAKGTAVITIGLAAASTWIKPLTVKNTGSYNVTLDGNGSELIEGAATLTLAPGEYKTLMSDGTAIQIIR